jgi:hypothetical protein
MNLLVESCLLYLPTLARREAQIGSTSTLAAEVMAWRCSVALVVDADAHNSLRMRTRIFSLWIPIKLSTFADYAQIEDQSQTHGDLNPVISKDEGGVGGSELV